MFKKNDLGYKTWMVSWQMEVMFMTDSWWWVSDLNIREFLWSDWDDGKVKILRVPISFELAEWKVVSNRRNKNWSVDWKNERRFKKTNFI